MAFVPFFDLGAEGAAREAGLFLTLMAFLARIAPMKFWNPEACLFLTFMAFMACIERMEFLDPNMPTL